MARKIILLIILFTTLNFIAPTVARADMANPEFYTERCNLDEETVTCDFHREEIGGPLTLDECGKYKNNPNYRFLTGSGGTFGGTSKYCLKAGAQGVGIEGDDSFLGVVFRQKEYSMVIGAVMIIVAMISFMVLIELRKRSAYVAQRALRDDLNKVKEVDDDSGLKK